MRRLVAILILVALVAGVVWWMNRRPGEDPGGGARRRPVGQFVRTAFIHGVPFEQASAYPARVVPELLAMLDDPAEEPHWPVIVTTVCMIGDAQAVDPLIQFIEASAAETLSQPHYHAKGLALMGLGYVVNKSQDPRALAYLRDGVDPLHWRDDQLEWESPFGENRDFVRGHLARLSVLGLGLAGTRGAEQVLRGLDKAGPEASPFEQGVRPVVVQSLATNLEVQKKGLAGYYAGADH